MASKGSTTKVASPTIKLSSLKVPNAAKAAKPIVDKKMAKLSFGPNQPKASAYKPPTGKNP